MTWCGSDDKTHTTSLESITLDVVHLASDCYSQCVRIFLFCFVCSFLSPSFVFMFVYIYFGSFCNPITHTFTGNKREICWNVRYAILSQSIFLVSTLLIFNQVAQTTATMTPTMARVTPRNSSALARAGGRAPIVLALIARPTTSALAMASARPKTSPRVISSLCSTFASLSPISHLSSFVPSPFSHYYDHTTF